jgi:hypothetical protein
VSLPGSCSLRECPTPRPHQIIEERDTAVERDRLALLDTTEQWKDALIEKGPGERPRQRRRRIVGLLDWAEQDS